MLCLWQQPRQKKSPLVVSLPPGEDSTILDFNNFGLFSCSCVRSLIIVTSVPVLILNCTSVPWMFSFVVHGFVLSVMTASMKNYLSSSVPTSWRSALTSCTLLHIRSKCPFLWHFLHVFPLAAQFSSCPWPRQHLPHFWTSKLCEYK